MTSRIAIFSPYAARHHVLAYEATIAKGCQVRGAEVEFLLCDGQLPECDMHWDSFPGNVTQRPLHLCTSCQSRTRRNFGFPEFALPHRWLGQFISASERSAAFAWAQQVLPEDMRAAVYQDLPIGEWVLSSVVTYFRLYPPDMTNWRVASVYRGFLFSGALAAIGLGNYLDSVEVDAALLFNGRQSVTRVAFEIFRRRGIRVLTHEFPFYQRGYLMVKPNARCWSNEPFLDFWQTWGKLPLERTSLEEARRWLSRRRYGSGLSWYAFNRPYLKPGSVRADLKISPAKKLLALFPSSMDEISGDPELAGPYPSQTAWIEDVLAWVARRDDVELVIRAHPHLAGNAGLGRAEDEYGYFARLKAAQPANTQVVMPDSPLNSYALMDAADICLSFGSSVGFEMAMLGKPVVLASRASYEDGTHIIKVTRTEDLPAALERSLTAGPAREIRRDGFRLAYYYAFRFERPFPLVDMAGVMDANLTWSAASDLAPGRDPVLDRICDHLISNAPLFPAPSPDDLARTTAEEDAFFAELEQSPAPFVDRAYERLLRFNAMTRSVEATLKRLPLGLGKASSKLASALFLPIRRLLKSRA